MGYDNPVFVKNILRTATISVICSSHLRKSIFYKAFTQNRKVGSINKGKKAPELITGAMV